MNWKVIHYHFYSTTRTKQRLKKNLFKIRDRIGESLRKLKDKDEISDLNFICIHFLFHYHPKCIYYNPSTSWWLRRMDIWYLFMEFRWFKTRKLGSKPRVNCTFSSFFLSFLWNFWWYSFIFLER